MFFNPRCRKTLTFFIDGVDPEGGQAIGDMRLAMEGAFETTVAGDAALPVEFGTTGWRPSLPLAGLAVLVAGIVSGFAVWSSTQSEAPGMVRFQIPVPLATAPSEAGLLQSNVTIAPDGSFVVYMAPDRSMLRYIDSLEETAIPGAIGGGNPVVSPDGEWIGFWVDGQLKKVSVNGGGAVTLCDAAVTFGISWGPHDTILFAQTDGVWRVPGSGGVCEKLIDFGEGELLAFPRMLPGTDWLLMTAGVPQNPHTVVQSLATGERTVVLEDRGMDALYLASGHLIYQSGDALRAVPFDLASRTVTGGPVELVQGLAADQFPQVGLSETGTLAYLTRSGSFSANRPVWVDRQGIEEPLSLEPANYRAARVSPDGRRIAVGRQDSHQFDEHIWIHDLTRGGQERLTLEGGNRWPVWTDDGAQIAFASTRLGEGLLQMFKKPVDGSGTAAPILSEDERDSIVIVPMSWSPHARALAFYKGRTLASTLSTGAVGDIWVLPEDGPPAAFVAGQFNNRSPSFSQDGRWLAYTSDESGYIEVYARPYPGPGPRVAISTAGGVPRWTRP